MTPGIVMDVGDVARPIVLVLTEDVIGWSTEVCPLCQTEGPLRSDPRAPRWRCRQCTQSWTPERLTAVAAYAAYCRARGA
jgi:hypothetical protein